MKSISNLRPCVVKLPNDLNNFWADAYFHRWCDKSKIDEMYGIVNYVVGIIEYEDGTIDECEPKSIKFTDVKEDINRPFKIGDAILCTESGVVGTVIKFYTPTASDEQTMVLTDDGRRYHAPTGCWVKYDQGVIKNHIAGKIAGSNSGLSMYDGSKFVIDVTNACDTLTLSNRVMTDIMKNIRVLNNSGVINGGER